MVQTTARCPGNWNERPRSGVNFCELLGAREGRGLGGRTAWRVETTPPTTSLSRGHRAGGRGEEALVSVQLGRPHRPLSPLPMLQPTQNHKGPIVCPPGGAWAQGRACRNPLPPSGLGNAYLASGTA